MARSLGNKTSRGSVGLDLDGGFIAAVQAADGQISDAVSRELPADIVRDGEVVDAEALTTVLREFFRVHELPKRVRLGVANQQIVVRQLELPRIEDQADLAAAVRFQAAEAIAMPLDEAVLDHQVIGETVSPEGTARLQVVVVAAREAMIGRLVESVRDAGLRPEGVDLNAFALVRALAGPADTDETARVYCHLGGVTNLAIAVGSACYFTRPLSTGWDDEGDSTAPQLAEEIRLSIDYYMAQPDARPAGEVLLSGPGAARPGLADELNQLIYLPVSVADPLGGLQQGGLPPEEDPYRHTVAMGLALGATA